MSEEKVLVIDFRLSKGVVVALLGLLILFSYQPSAGRESATASGEREVTQVEGLRQFYLSIDGGTGMLARNKCDLGYHMASLWEIADPTNLKYNTSLGYQQEDSGEGPPADLSWAYGWVRTGYINYTSNTPGRANCDSWTVQGLTTYGTIAALPSQWTSGLEDISVWQLSTQTCNVHVRVWCIED